MKKRLPLVHPYRYYAEAGALMTYGPDVAERYRLGATYIDRILKGEKPANLPVQLPTRYNFVLNLKTAKVLGLSIPDKVIALADEVIELRPRRRRVASGIRVSNPHFPGLHRH